MTSSGAGRIDAYRYEEHGRELTLGGEGVELMEIIIPPCLAWDDDLSTPIDDAQAKRILRNITGAIQRCGFEVSFAYSEPDIGNAEK